MCIASYDIRMWNMDINHKIIHQKLVVTQKAM